MRQLFLRDLKKEELPQKLIVRKIVFPFQEWIYNLVMDLI